MFDRAKILLQPGQQGAFGTALKYLARKCAPGRENIDREIKAVGTEAADFAQESPEPDASELYTDVLVEV